MDVDHTAGKVREQRRRDPTVEPGHHHELDAARDEYLRHRSIEARAIGVRGVRHYHGIDSVSCRFADYGRFGAIAYEHADLRVQRFSRHCASDDVEVATYTGRQDADGELPARFHVSGP